MRLEEQEVSIFRDGDSKVMHISASINTDRNRLIKLADELDLPVDVNDDYVNVDVDLNKFNIRYNHTGVTVAKREVMSEAQLEAARKNMAAIHAEKR